MNRTFHSVASLLLLVLASGCIPVSRSSVASVGGEERGAALDASPNPTRVSALTEELLALGSDVSPDEAKTVADVAVHYSEQLAESYDMVNPVELHNVLVNVGLRRGGLCYEYAECMLAELRELPLKTLEFKRGIAWKDDLWNEHNCVVVTAIGRPFESGVVLDAWRNGGRLRWAPVRMDHYPWQPKPAPAREMIVSSPPRGAHPPAERARNDGQAQQGAAPAVVVGTAFVEPAAASHAEQARRSHVHALDPPPEK